MRWKMPKMVKVYEALGAVADGRVEVSGDTGKVWSSRRDKHYDIVYDPATQAVNSNDPLSRFHGTLGYPALAYLLVLGVIDYNKELAEALVGVAWKDINTKHKNDYEKAMEEVFENIADKVDRAELEKEAERISGELKALGLEKPGR